ncbi:hypothetical protein Y032_0900g2946 [Ancylostoma ceylanicum]|uniref:ShKT domain-containing protein n=1 Tax=Ancylostoma ceylanicum TaxID=53326 RepID=A0A016W9T5_9BILA|nr:hypothetical protein Y032_0900g2946 [Ancylostoma ceylanicum]
MRTSGCSVLILLSSIVVLSHAVAQDNAEFLFENAKICGDPFSDPIWIPTLDLCMIECDQDTEYCVENEDLQQQCKKMPEECQKLLQEKKKQQKG